MINGRTIENNTQRKKVYHTCVAFLAYNCVRTKNDIYM